eukprot:809498_1
MPFDQADSFEEGQIIPPEGAVGPLSVLYTEIEARDELLKTLRLERDIPNRNRDAAGWRIRKKVQSDIHSELQKLGKLAVLACGSMLVTYSNDRLNYPVRHPGWRQTLEESPLLEDFNDVQRGQIFGAKTQNWTRLEESIRNLGNCLCLAVKDLNDKKILLGFNKLKTHVLKHAFASDRKTDLWIEYLKWLGKSSQYVFLNEPVILSEQAVLDEEGCLLPFVGSLSYIGDSILNYRRRREAFTYEEARQLTQIAQIPRGHCYPSREQQKESIKETIETMTSQFTPSEPALDRHRKGLLKVLERIPKRPKTSHVSINTSGRLEASRSKGGGGPALIRATRSYTDQELDLEAVKPLIGRFDQFGSVILDKATLFIAGRLLKKEAYNVNPTIGDILYVKPHEIDSLWKANLKSTSKRVPTKLGQILNLTASMAIREVGHYSEEPTMTLGIMSFGTRGIKFLMDVEGLPVRAGLSVEKGLKTRLTTSAMAAFSHLSQLPANYMRETLSQDPFLKTGLDEPDKLWQVLKAYKSRTAARP